jgi:hypothetical protein
LQKLCLGIVFKNNCIVMLKYYVALAVKPI